jgi:predicted Zn-dependent peptidase
MTGRPIPALLAALALAACAVPARQGAGPAAPLPDRARIPANGPPPTLAVPAQKHFRLDNGLRVRLVEYHRLPIVALNLVLDAGAVHDPTARPGLASFTAAMVTEGTRTRSATRLSDELGFIGAHLSAGASFDAASVAGSSLSRHLEKLLELLADVTVDPAFPPEDFARVQDQRKVSLVQQRDSPGAVASKAFAEAFWVGHPYGHWSMGTEDSLASMKPEDLARFHAARWRPGSAELVVVGDVSEADLSRMLAKTLARWPAGERPAAEPAKAPAVSRRAIVLGKADAPQAFVMMGMPGLSRASPDYVAAQVAFHILGGGSSSRLFRDLREKRGYTYGIYARAEARKLGGTSYIVGSVRAEVTGDALRELLAQVEALRSEPVPEGELADAKAALVLSLPAEFATAAGIAGKLADEALHGLPDDYWDRYAAQVQQVTAADVRRVAQRYLDPASLLTVMVADPAVVKGQLDGLPIGPVEVRAGTGPGPVGGPPGSGGPVGSPR